MTIQAKRTVEAVAVAVVLALAAALALPRGPRRPAETGAAAQAPAAVGGSAPGVELPQPSSPEQIARLFGWRPPVPQPAQPAPAAAMPPLPADWLAYVGFVADAAGERFLFKDRRTGKVVPVSPSSADWHLVETRANELIAEHDGKLYILKRGK